MSVYDQVIVPGILHYRMRMVAHNEGIAGSSK